MEGLKGKHGWRAITCSISAAPRHTRDTRTCIASNIRHGRNFCQYHLEASRVSAVKNELLPRLLLEKRQRRAIKQLPLESLYERRQALLSGPLGNASPA